MKKMTSSSERRQVTQSGDSSDSSDTAPIWIRTVDGLQLIGWACRACGQRGLPQQSFGCERCGADREHIERSEFAAKGTLRSFATIERHAVWPVPFLMGEIQLDSGHIIHSFLSEGPTWKAGERVASQGGDESRQDYLIFELEEKHATH